MCKLTLAVSASSRNGVRTNEKKIAPLGFHVGQFVDDGVGSLLVGRRVDEKSVDPPRQRRRRTTYKFFKQFIC